VYTLSYTSAAFCSEGTGKRNGASSPIPDAGERERNRRRMNDLILRPTLILVDASGFFFRTIPGAHGSPA
jgi:hypothetical protein